MIAWIRRELKVYRLVLNHPRTPRLSRWLLAGALAYLCMPLDLIPDWIPLLGQLDDLLIVPLMIALALWFMPKDILAECRQEQARRQAHK